jgi:hypothetical protein
MRKHDKNTPFCRVETRLNAGVCLALLPMTLLLAACGVRSASPPAPQAADPPRETSAMSSTAAHADTSIEMSNVNIHLDPQLIVSIRRLSGHLVPTKQGQAASFDDKRSYVIATSSAEIAVSMASMTRLMNAYVFGDEDAPLKNLELSIENGQLRQKGILRKGPDVPFEMVAETSPTPDGRIRIHPRHLKAAHLPVKGLMKLFGVEMAKVINTRHTRGITVDDNDIILDPAVALPPPSLRGRITAIRIEGDQLVQTFGEGKPAPPSVPASNYMAYRGGVLRFGKLTMNDTDMRLIDANPADPFEFFPDRYKDQLVAGYSKTTPAGGLLVYMPDFGKISKPRPSD